VAAKGMAVGELARYLMVSRQNLTGLLGRMARDGHVVQEPDPDDKRAKLVKMSESGRRVWLHEAAPKIAQYYGEALAGFSTNDLAHTLHYLLKLLDNMQAIDAAHGAPAEED
jgi:DNA-binding MarR family transcriptional regulator